MLEALFEMLAQLIFEGAFEASTYKRVPLWLRWILIIIVAGFIIFVGGVLLVGVIFSGQNTTTVVKITIGIVGLLIIGGGISLIIRFLRSLKNKNHF